MDQQGGLRGWIKDLEREGVSANLGSEVCLSVRNAAWRHGPTRRPWGSTGMRFLPTDDLLLR